MNYKLLMVDKKSGNTASRARGAEMAGWDVHWVEPYWDDGLGRVSLGLQFRAKNGIAISAWNKSIIQAAQWFKATVLWVEAPQFIFPETLKQIKESTGAMLVCAYSDDPRSSVNKSRHFENSKTLYDVIFATKDDLLQQLMGDNVRCVAKFWKGFDPDRIRPRQLATEEYKRWWTDILFIGHVDKVGKSSKRQPIMEKIASNFSNFNVYGRSWGMMPVSEKLGSCIEPYQLDSIDYSQAISATKIALQIPSRLQRDTHSSRSIEIPACRTLMLAERTVDHLFLFEEDKEAIYFSCMDELIDKARFYINNESAREKIAQAGYRRCLDSGYSNYERMREMLAKVEQFMSKKWI